MTIEHRKYDLVQLIMSIRDDKKLEAYEEVQRLQRIKEYEESLKPMSKEEYVRHIEEAEKDIEHGRLIDAKDLEKEMDNWFS